MGSDHTTDEELVTAAQAGNAAALAGLYERHVMNLYRFIYRHVDHVENAEDLASEVVIRMVKNLKQFNRDSSFKTWLYGIARYVIADFWRTRYRMREELIAEYVGSDTAELYGEVVGETAKENPDELLLHEQQIKAERVFRELPEQYRTVLRHRFLEQHTLDETAKTMATTVGNVKVLQHRALKKAASIAKNL